MNEKEQLVEIGYKNLVYSVISSGFFEQFIREDEVHFVNFKNNPDFFLKCLEKLKEKYTPFDKVLNNFFKINPEEKNNINLMKRILKISTNAEDVEIIFRNCGEDNFIKDYDLMRTVAQNTNGGIFREKVSTKILKDEKLRDYISDIEGFSLLWFDLEEPKNDKVLLSVLQKDFHSYRKLNDENKENKEYLIAALSNLKEEKQRGVYLNIESQIYTSIPNSLKKDNEIALLLAEVGFVKQDEYVFKDEKVLAKIIEANFSDKKSSKSVNFLEDIPKTIFKNYKNIEVFLDGISKYAPQISGNNDNYGILHKIIKSMAKENSYVKELFKKEDSNWNNGNITDTKYESKSFFREVFTKKFPKMLEEFQYYVRMQELKESLDKKQVKKTTIKI